MDMFSLDAPIALDVQAGTKIIHALLLPPRLPCARMAEQIATWMHYPTDQKLLSLMFPARATRTDMAMSMLPVGADGLMRKWRKTSQLTC